VPRRSSRRKTSEPVTRATNRRSTRKSNNSSSPRECHGGENGREGEEETDDNLPALDEQESTLDDNGQCGGGEQRVIAIPVAPKRRSAIKSFDERFEELMKFKTKFGHCNVSRAKSSEYYSLGQWCNKTRSSYVKIQKGDNTHRNLTDDHIRRLTR